jgi:hypothetical protein
MGSKQQTPLSHHPYPHPPSPTFSLWLWLPAPSCHFTPTLFTLFPTAQAAQQVTNATTCQCRMPVVPKLISWVGLHCYSLDSFVDSYRIWPNIFVFMTSTTKVLTVLFCCTPLGNYAHSTRLCKQSLPIMAKICGSGLVWVQTWKLP